MGNGEYHHDDDYRSAAVPDHHSAPPLPSYSHQPISLQAHYVPAWEGLRGLAVLMTVVHHFQQVPEPMNSLLGRGGVAIFFVLSGFLITGVLNASMQRISAGRSHHRHLPRFFKDRFARLYPGLVLMLFSTTALAYLYVPQTVGKTTLRYILLALTYTSNLIKNDLPSGAFWQSTWTLSLEQQFYIVWAILLPYLMATSVRNRLTLVALLILASATLNYRRYAKIDDRDTLLTGYFAPFPNVYKMLVGAWTQLAVPVLPKFITQDRRTCWLGMALLSLYALSLTPASGPLDAASVLHLDGRLFGFDVWLEPWTAGCTALMLLGSQYGGNVLLQLQVLRYLGRVSYAWYLYQAPLFWIRANTRWDTADAWPKGLDACMYSVVALAAAHVSTVYVEEPARRWYKQRKSKSSNSKY